MISEHKVLPAREGIKEVRVASNQHHWSTECVMAVLECAGYPVVKHITEERVEVRAFNVTSRSRITCTFGVKAVLHDPVVLHSEDDSILCGSDSSCAQ